MSELVLRFQSPEIRFGVIGEATPAQAQVEGWSLRDKFSPRAYPDHGNGVGSYHLVVERTLTLNDDAWDWHNRGVELLERIEHIWAFANGLPIRSCGFGAVLAAIEPPTGWTTNVKAVDHAIQAATGSLITGNVSISSRHWQYATRFPAATLPRALSAYETANDLAAELIALHYEAHMSTSKDGRAFLLAKALEIARELLPGKDDEGREKSLEAEIRAELTQP